MKLVNWVNFANDQTAESDHPGGSYVVTVFLIRKRRQLEMSESDSTVRGMDW